MYRVRAIKIQRFCQCDQISFLCFMSFRLLLIMFIHSFLYFVIYSKVSYFMTPHCFTGTFLSIVLPKHVRQITRCYNRLLLPFLCPARVKFLKSFHMCSKYFNCFFLIVINSFFTVIILHGTHPLSTIFSIRWQNI